MQVDVKKKVVGIIPARYGSQRLPKKMLADVNGVSLIQRTYENASRCELLEELFVATDHEDIYDLVISFGGKALMTSADCPTGTDRLAEAVENAPVLAGYEIIINIQGDEPTIAALTIEKVATALLDDETAVASTAATPIHDDREAHDPAAVKCVFTEKGEALYFSRGYIPHGLEGLFSPKVPCYRHLGIYGFTRPFLLQYPKLAATPLQQAENLEQLKILEHGYKIKVVVVDDQSIGIDTHADLERLRSR